jgi:flagellar basal body-associated protein FliL
VLQEENIENLDVNENSEENKKKRDIIKLIIIIVLILIVVIGLGLLMKSLMNNTESVFGPRVTDCEYLKSIMGKDFICSPIK